MPRLTILGAWAFAFAYLQTIGKSLIFIHEDAVAGVAASRPDGVERTVAIRMVYHLSAVHVAILTLVGQRILKWGWNEGFG